MHAVKEIIGDFSEAKFNGLNSDYGDLYPGITSFVERVFRESKATMSGAELGQQIEANAQADPAAEKDSFYTEKWFTDRSRQRLAMLMYEIGVVGFGVEPDITYAIKSPTISQADLMSKMHLVIHPAFRPYLGFPAKGPRPRPGRAGHTMLSEYPRTRLPEYWYVSAQRASSTTAEIGLQHCPSSLQPATRVREARAKR